jgi:hypothetical protein
MPVPLICYAVLIRDLPLTYDNLDETDNLKICIFLFDDVSPALFLYADNMHGVALTYAPGNAATGVSMKTGL